MEKEPKATMKIRRALVPEEFRRASVVGLLLMKEPKATMKMRRALWYPMSSGELHVVGLLSVQTPIIARPGTSLLLSYFGQIDLVGQSSIGSY